MIDQIILFYHPLNHKVVENFQKQPMN